MGRSLNCVNDLDAVKLQFSHWFSKTQKAVFKSHTLGNKLTNEQKERLPSRISGNYSSIFGL